MLDLLAAAGNNIGASTALSFAQNIFGGLAQSRLGKRQAAAYADAAADDFQALGERARQIGGRASEQMGIRAQQAAREIGRLNAVLGDSGLTGATAMRLRQELAFDASRDTAMIRHNMLGDLDQTVRQGSAVGNKYRSAVAGIKRPSVFEGLLNVGGAAISDKGPSVTGAFKKLFD